MLAVRDIAALETILVERAAASGPKLAHPAVCVECLASVDTRYSFWLRQELKTSQRLSICHNFPRALHLHLTKSDFKDFCLLSFSSFSALSALRRTKALISCPHSQSLTPFPSSVSFISCTSCGLPFCSKRCRTLRKLHTAKECALISRSSRELGKEDLAEDSGVLASLTAARLLSLREEEPELFQRVDMLMDNMDKIRWGVNKKLLHNRSDDVNTKNFCRDSPDFVKQEKCVNFLLGDCAADQFSAEEIHRALGIFASNSCNMAGNTLLSLVNTSNTGH